MLLSSGARALISQRSDWLKVLLWPRASRHQRLHAFCMRLQSDFEVRASRRLSRGGCPRPRAWRNQTEIVTWSSAKPKCQATHSASSLLYLATKPVKTLKDGARMYPASLLRLRSGILVARLEYKSTLCRPHPSNRSPLSRMTVHHGLWTLDSLKHVSNLIFSANCLCFKLNYINYDRVYNRHKNDLS